MTIKEEIELEFSRRKRLLLAVSVGEVEEDGKSYDLAVSGATMRIGGVYVDLTPVIERAILFQKRDEK